MNPQATAVDLARRYVRVLRETEQGMVAFEFAIGWPDMSVELAMPRAMFEAFCRNNEVVRLADGEAAAKLGEATGETEGEDE